MHRHRTLMTGTVVEPEVEEVEVVMMRMMVMTGRRHAAPLPEDRVACRPIASSRHITLESICRIRSDGSVPDRSASTPKPHDPAGL